MIEYTSGVFILCKSQFTSTLHSWQFGNIGKRAEVTLTPNQSVTVPIILSDTDTNTFSGTRYLRYRYRYFFPVPNFDDTDTDTFFRYQILPIPIPILFSGTQNARYRFRYLQYIPRPSSQKIQKKNMFAIFTLFTLHPMTDLIMVIIHSNRWEPCTLSDPGADIKRWRTTILIH